MFTLLPINNMIGVLIGKLSGVKRIIGGVRTSNLPYHKFILVKFIHNYFLTLTMFNNSYGKDKFVKNGFVSSKCVLIPNCIDNNDKFIKLKNAECNNIITIARFIPDKDYFTAIKAIEYLVKHYLINNQFKIKYYIVGYGLHEMEIKKEIIKRNLLSVITLVNNGDPNKYYRIGHIYLSTSRVEGLSNSILEAMSYSLSIVATRVGDNPHLVINEQNGYLCDVGDWKSIADNLYYLINNMTICRSMGERSKKIVNSNYSFNSFKENILELINRITNKNNI